MTWLVFYICYTTFGWVIRLGMVFVVLRRQMATGASIAWLGIVFLHPYVGLSLYLLVGESRLGPRRTARHRQIVAQFRVPARKSESAQIEVDAAPYKAIARQAQKIGDMPVVAGNSAEFYPETDRFVDGLIADINAAKSQIHLLYYIFACDNVGSRVAEALIAAKRRGVQCRVIADGMASRVFFHRAGLGPKLSAAGVEVVVALPVTPLRRRLARMDLRNHRKLAVIDNALAWVGSHNLINPDYGGRRGNPWVDVTARMTGPVVGELAMVFAEDWAFEKGVDLPLQPVQSAPPANSQNAVSGFSAQVVPTGPTIPGVNFRRLLLEAIQSASRELVLTTPYFVPDEPTLMAMTIAADRGVDVKLIVPQKLDLILAAAAGRAQYQRLLDNGISIHLYQPGLLHAKTTTVDDSFALFGTANLDVRSFELNFELSVLAYGPEVTRRLREIQQTFLQNSRPIDPKEWDSRPVINQYADRAVSLLSPLL
jgi:cardiolipin synthase A/B